MRHYNFAPLILPAPMVARVRPLLTVLTLAVLAALAVGPDPASAPEPQAAVAAEPRPQLPWGGRRIFPDSRVVAFYGAPQNRALGILGIGRPRDAARKLRRQMRPYRRAKLPVRPAFELLATIALANPGAGGKYRGRQSPEVIGRYLRAARRAGAILILDIQPGRSDFMTEARALRRWLREPDVSLALDPEWNMGPRGVPGTRIGSVDATMVNRVGAYMDRIVRRRDLPQKLLLVHKFTDTMVRRQRLLRQRRRVALTFSVDGVGGSKIKIDKYRYFTRKPDGIWDAFKIFYEEDPDPISPRRVLGLRPPPRLVIYE